MIETVIHILKKLWKEHEGRTVCIPVAGVSYRQKKVRHCYNGQALRLVRDPNNEYDPCAIKVLAGKHLIGFIPRGKNELLAEYMDRGGTVKAKVAKVVGGTRDKPTVGIRMNVYIPEEVESDFDHEDFVD